MIKNVYRHESALFPNVYSQQRISYERPLPARAKVLLISNTQGAENRHLVKLPTADSCQ
jgi:hypothetical protein